MNHDWRDIWDKYYPIVIPVLASGACLWLRISSGGEFFTGKFFTDALNGVMTADSIILALFGVVITLFASARGQSKAIDYFCASADMNLFSRYLKACIMVGFLSVASCVGMYFIDIYQDQLLLPTWVGLFIALLCQSYRFMSYIITLLFNNNMQSSN